jgi:hypothetical protein
MKINLCNIREKLERLYDWSYVESEGENDLRFDWDNGSCSFWIRNYGKATEVEGSVPARVRRYLIQQRFTVRPERESLMS